MSRGSPYKLENWVSWNPMTGCDPKGLSPGCDNCWARILAHGRHNDATFAPTFHPERLGKITGSCGVSKVYVTNFMGDWMADEHESDSMRQMFTTMKKNQQHTFLTLTKRPERLNSFLRGACPMSNVWLGVTAENEEARIQRTHELAKIKGWNKWLSLEPLLEPVTLSERYMYGVRWVVVGCESGSNRRPCKPEWVRDVVRQCAALGVPCYVKQIVNSPNKTVQKNWGTSPGSEVWWPEDLRVRQLPEELVK